MSISSFPYAPTRTNTRVSNAHGRTDERTTHGSIDRTDRFGTGGNDEYRAGVIALELEIRNCWIAS